MFLYNNENGHLYDIVMDDYLSVGLLILAIFCFRKLCANVDRVDKYVAIFLFVVSCGLVCNTQLGRINDWRRLSERIADDSFFLIKGELQSVGITQRDVLINIKGEKYTLSKERRFSARDELNKLKEGDHVELKIWDERMLTLSIYTVWVKQKNTFGDTPSSQSGRVMSAETLYAMDCVEEPPWMGVYGEFLLALPCTPHSSPQLI